MKGFLKLSTGRFMTRHVDALTYEKVLCYVTLARGPYSSVKLGCPCTFEFPLEPWALKGESPIVSFFVPMAPFKDSLQRNK